jgi:hypothetical protein
MFFESKGMSMDAIVGIINNIVSSVLGWFNGVWDANENYVIAVLICVGVGFIFLPNTKPARVNLPVVAYLLWSIAAAMLALLLNFSAIDATIVGLLALAISAGVLAAEKFHDRSKLVGLLWGVGAIVAVVSLFAVSQVNPQGGYLPSAFLAIRDVGATLWTSITGSI